MPRSNPFDELHKNYISATMASVIAGVNPWQTPFSLWSRWHGPAEERKESYAMRRGTFMEVGLMREFTIATKLKVRRPNASKRIDERFLYTTEEFGFPMSALLDGVTIDSTGEAVVEGKTSSNPFGAHEWYDDDDEQQEGVISDKVPLIYYLQVQHQLAVTGWFHGYVTADVLGKHVVRLVKRDDNVIALLTTRERDFWHRCVVGGESPEVDGEEATSAAIKRMWPHSTEEFCETIADLEVYRLAQEYKSEGTLMGLMKKEREKTGNRLKTVIQDREALVVQQDDMPSLKVSWKSYQQNSFNLEAFREAHPDLAAKFTEKADRRPLKVTEVKE